MPTAHTLVSNEVFELNAPPDLVFPLLCPTREHDWIPTWRATIVHSKSGLAELDCVFTTDNSEDGHRTWVCTHYEPRRAIGYTIFSTAGYVSRLDIRLDPYGNGTRVHWSRRFIACSDEGNAWIDSRDPDRVASTTRMLAKLLAHYLETGTMLRA